MKIDYQDCRLDWFLLSMEENLKKENCELSTLNSQPKARIRNQKASMTVLKEAIIFWIKISDYWKLIMALIAKEWDPEKKEHIWTYSEEIEALGLPRVSLPLSDNI